MSECGWVCSYVLCMYESTKVVDSLLYEYVGLVIIVVPPGLHVDPKP